jgi:hypothetical protein
MSGSRRHYRLSNLLLELAAQDVVDRGGRQPTADCQDVRRVDSYAMTTPRLEQLRQRQRINGAF